MEWMLTRPVVIGFAVTGGALSVVTMLLRHRGKNTFTRQIEIAGYFLMGISMLLYIVVGFRGQP